MAGQIADNTWALMVASGRLDRYRATRDERSAEIQQGVIDRLLDERLVLRREAA